MIESRDNLTSILRAVGVTVRRYPTSKNKGEATTRQQEGSNHNKIKSHTHRGGNTKTGEQLNRRSSPTDVKVLSPKSGFPAWGSSKGTGNPQGI